MLLALVSELPFAAAHAVLVEQFPQEDAVLATSPGEVRLRFDEPVAPVVVRVLDTEGRPVVGPDAVSVRDTTVHIRFPGELGAGSYVVSYRVISADSHPVGGSFAFAIGDTNAATSPKRSDDAPNGATWTAVRLVLRAIFYAAFLVGVGGALFRLLIDRDASAAASDRRDAVAGCLAAAIAIVGLLGVEGSIAAAAPFGGILDPAIWLIGIRSTLGLSALITIVGLSAVAVAMLADGRWRAAWLGAAGSVIAASGFATTGHVATASPSWLTGPVLVLHVLGAAYWVGALPPLYRRLARAPATAVAAVVTRFSRIAVAGVAVLVTAGLVIACVQVRAPAALLDTEYGQRLLVKLALVAGLLLLAAWNKWRLTPRLANGDPAALHLLRRTIAAELALATGILVMTATLGQTPPPRVLVARTDGHHHAGAPSAGFTIAIPSGDRVAILDVAPARRGENRLTVTLTAADGRPLAVLGVTIRLASRDLGIEASEHIAARTTPGHYEATAQLPVAGTWTVEIEVLVTDFERMDLKTTVPIR